MTLTLISLTDLITVPLIHYHGTYCTDLDVTVGRSVDQALFGCYEEAANVVNAIGGGNVSPRSATYSPTCIIQSPFHHYGMPNP